MRFKHCSRGQLREHDLLSDFTFFCAFTLIFWFLLSPGIGDARYKVLRYKEALLWQINCRAMLHRARNNHHGLIG